jgi:hypothetical protein
MVRPSDFWPDFKKEWYDDETGELKEPHRSRLLANGTSIERLAAMELQVRSEIEEFHLKNQMMPLVDGKNWAEQELEQQAKRRQRSRAELHARYSGTYDPDKNYD